MNIEPLVRLAIGEFTIDEILCLSSSQAGTLPLRRELLSNRASDGVQNGVKRHNELLLLISTVFWDVESTGRKSKRSEELWERTVELGKSLG